MKRLSLEALTRLAEEAEREATTKGKLGVVAVKVSPTLIVMTEGVWRSYGALYSRGDIGVGPAPPFTKGTSR